MAAVTTLRNNSATAMFRSGDLPVMRVITTERPSMPATVTAVQTRNTGHPDKRTNHSVQLTGESSLSLRGRSESSQAAC